MAVKRNLKALRRWKTVFAKVPADQVHMGEVFGHRACGTVGCLWGWGANDSVLQKMGIPGIDEGAEFFGIPNATFEALILNTRTPEQGFALSRNPHAISKKQVLDNLDRVIAGKPIKPYVV